MRFPFLFLSLFLTLSAVAQITIGPNDMPSAGDTMRYRTTMASGVDLTLTGSDVTWDFSLLSIGSAGADTAVSVGSTPFAYQLFFNNPFLYPQHAANFAMKGVEFGFQGFSFEDVYDYYKKGAAAYSNVGFGANLNGLPTSVRRDPVDIIHRFPMHPGDQDTSFSSFSVSLPTLGYYRQDQTRFNHVDGWGTLILPSDTFDVLRVRSVLQQRDTVFIDQFGFGFGLNRPQTVEYRWLAQGMDQPVLIVTTVAGQATIARFYYDPEPLTTSIPEAAVATGLVAWPNPVSDVVHVQLPHNVGGHLAIHDAAGRIVMQLGPLPTGHLQHIPVQALPAGAYSAVLNGDVRSASRFVVHH